MASSLLRSQAEARLTEEDGADEDGVAAEELGEGADDLQPETERVSDKDADPGQDEAGDWVGGE